MIAARLYYSRYEFPVELKGTITTPANDSLFKSVDSKALSKQRSEVFHTYVAKALFLAKRGRPDILPTVAFLCTRVTQSTEQDWHKLCRMIDFLKRTKKEVLRIQIEHEDLRHHLFHESHY